MEKSSSILLLLMFSGLCFIAQAYQTAVANDFVKNTCLKHGKLSNICIGVVDSDPHQEWKLDLSGLLAIFISHSIAKATDNRLYLLEQIKRTELDNKTRNIFKICVDNYDRGIEILTSSLDGLLKKHDRELSLSTSDAFGKIGECEDEFEYTPEPSPWLSRYRSLDPLLQLSMGTANLLQCQRVAACYGPS